MKFKLSSRHKWIFVAIMQMILVLSVIALIQTIGKKRYQEIEEVKYNYSNHLNVNYEVNMIENPIFNTKTLSEGMVYSKKLIEDITIKFKNDFSSSEACLKEMEYRVYGVVRGTGNITGKTTDYWKKKYPYKEKKLHKFLDADVTKEESVTIDLEPYNSFARQAYEATGYSVCEVLDVILEGNIRIHSQYGDATVPLNAKVSIPLREQAFTISKESEGERKNSISEYKKAIIKVDQRKVKISILTMVMSVLFTLFCLVFTVKPTKSDCMCQCVKRIFKNYGSRLIGIKFFPQIEYQRTYQVVSIEDLIKTADEIQKPICYQMDEMKCKDKISFQLIDGNNRYIYEVNEG